MSNEPNALDPCKPKPAEPTESSIANETAFLYPKTPTDVPRAPGATGGAGATSTADWAGKSLGKYQISAVLGQGGMGVVLKARDPLIEREVAIKVLADHLAADETARSRFLAEARAVGKLSHANVAGIFEICQEGDRIFLVMEYISGGSLSDRLEKQGALSILEATQALIDACRGLAAAHAAGLIHRDIKPANLMRAADGSVKVMDFGLAKADGGRHLTQTGVVMGTPFMSPEQCEAKPVDARGDIYSLGATYYSLLTGQNPYQQSTSIVQLMYSHVHSPPPDPRALRPEVLPACAQVVARAMAKSPGDRYQSASDMLADLMAIAAALSGQMIALPSQTQALPALATAATSGAVPSVQAAPPRRRQTIPLMAAVGLAVVAAILLVWRPWEKTGPSVIPPASGVPIKVGVLHSRSGTMSASELPVIDALRLAFDEINQAGGLLGRPVELVVADGRSDETVFAREAERLITQEKVVAIFGCWTSASRKAVKPVVEAHDHLLIYPL